MLISSPKQAVRQGFTLVEMLVVIAIIGVIAGLVTVAASRALTYAKKMVIVTDFTQLDMALKAYKDKYGEYPPDGTDYQTNYDPNTGIPNTFKRHFSRVFDKANLYDELHLLAQNYKLKCDPANGVGEVQSFFKNLGPDTSLAFWLGGMQEDDYSQVATKNPKSRFVGFSTNKIHPLSDNGSSRLPLWYEFDTTRITDPTGAAVSNTIFRQYKGNVNVTQPYVYFRAELNQQPWEYTNWSINTRPVKSFGNAKPYFDTTQTTATLPGNLIMPGRWVNPTSYQLLFCGFDGTFGSGNCYPTGKTPPPNKLPPPYDPNLLFYPYKPIANPTDSSQYDDITNFAGGAIEDKIP